LEEKVAASVSSISLMQICIRVHPEGGSSLFYTFLAKRFRNLSNLRNEESACKKLTFAFVAYSTVNLGLLCTNFISSVSNRSYPCCLLNMVFPRSRPWSPPCCAMSRFLHFLDNRLTDGRIFTFRKIPVRHRVHPRPIVGLVGLDQLKNPMTSTGREPAT
jgi:hypothetical protein